MDVARKVDEMSPIPRMSSSTELSSAHEKTDEGVENGSEGEILQAACIPAVPFPNREELNHYEHSLTQNLDVLELVRLSVESSSFSFHLDDELSKLEFPVTDDDVQVLVDGTLKGRRNPSKTPENEKELRMVKIFEAPSDGSHMQALLSKLQVLRQLCARYRSFVMLELELQRKFRLVPDAEFYERIAEIFKIFCRARQHLIRVYISRFMQTRAWKVQQLLCRHPSNAANISELAAHKLRLWLFDHILKPYPAFAEKMALAEQTGLDPGQVANWFINVRMRFWKPLLTFICPERACVRENDIRQKRKAPVKRKRSDEALMKAA